MLTDMRRIALISAAVLSTGFFILVAATLASPGAHHSFSIQSVLGGLVGIGLIWGCVSTWVRIWICKRADLNLPMRLLPGPRPSDPVAVRVWIWKWHFFAAALLVVLSGLAIAATIWLEGR